MKKILLITLLFFIALFCILSGSCSSSVTTEPVNVSETDEDKSEDIKYRVTKLSNYDAEDILENYFIYEYNEDGFLIKLKHYEKFENSFKLFGEYISEYNEKGYLIKTTTSFSEFPDLYTTYEYDDEGKLVKENVFMMETDVLSGYAIYEYDSNDHLIKETLYSLILNKEIFMFCYTYEYDDEGLLIKEFRYDSSDNLYGYFIYIYNENKNLIRVDGYELDDTLHGYSIYEYEEIP